MALTDPVPECLSLFHLFLHNSLDLKQQEHQDYTQINTKLSYKYI